VISARDEFVRVDLMASVPDQPIPTEVKDSVQGEAEFNNAKIRGKMSGATCGDLTERLPHFGSQIIELVDAEALEIVRGLNRRQNC
jgi:hypothetical protein